MLGCKIGSFCIAIVSIQLVTGVFRWIYQNFIGPNTSGKSTDFKVYGKWALITGATDGIGKEYTKSFAKRGLNVILVSRSLSKLETVAKEIREEFNVETKVIDVDFTSGPEIYDKIKSKIGGLEIGILVNNVGLSYSVPDVFLSVPDREKFINDIISCNITSMPMMCSIILPQMVNRHKGLIINLSSISAIIPAPMLTVYSASKAFADKFSADLAAEYESSGIVVQSILPGPVATNMSKIKKPTWMAPSPKVFVESALRTVGIAVHSTGYYAHALLQLSAQLLQYLAPGLSHKTTLKTFNNMKTRAIKRGLYQPASI